MISSFQRDLDHFIFLFDTKLKAKKPTYDDNDIHVDEG